MSDLERILLTAAATVTVGTLVFVLGQLASRFFIEPCYEQRRVIGRIAEALLDYMHMFADSADTPPPGAREAALHLRKMSSELMARTWAVPAYSLLSILRAVRKRADIVEANRGLIGLSNTLMERDWERKLELAKMVAKALRLESIDPELRSESI